jgi:phage tail-like protein
MPAPRPFALIRTRDQWLRASHINTALEGEVVQLYWGDEDTASGADDEEFTELGAGLAFDEHCRLYHSVPGEGRVERMHWASHDPLQPAEFQKAPVNLFETEIEAEFGDFVLSGPAETQLLAPAGLAVDDDDRLFVAESGAKRILIYDLQASRLLRRVQLAATVTDLVASGRTVYALLAQPPGLIKLTARTDPQTLELPAEIGNPSRLAISAAGELYILDAAGTADARVMTYPEGKEIVKARFATDIEFQTPVPSTVTASCNVLVIARRRDEDFLRFCIDQNDVSELPPLKARGYDGLGIANTPDGRIGFWTSSGFRHAVAARLRYLPTGQVTTFQLDSDEFHTVWGRLFLDACIPKNTSIVVRCITSDETPGELEQVARTPPANTSDPGFKVPPMPSPSLLKRLAQTPDQLLHRRETGRELPWVRLEETDSFETYEAPIIAEPGRYLWMQIELKGNTRTTPRLKSLRAEYPSHDYLRRIPKTFSRDEQVAGFLRRYLATFEGLMGELEAKADARATLLDPASAPAEILPWLASFLGLVLDERMARAPRPGGRFEDVRRTLVTEVTWLFRFRGTVAGLRRFIEIYLGTPPILIEHFRLRGLGDAILGDPSGLTSTSVVGAGFRVGGAIGEEEAQVLDASIEDSFATHAHRFALISPTPLNSEQKEVVNWLLELHRPAHTLVQLCTVEAGMRVGRGLHVELTSIIGRGNGFTQWQLGSGLLGRGMIIGKPEAGTSIGGSQVGRDSRVG